MIRNKTIKFDLEKPDERELWEWLQNLPHGKFSERVKNYWKSKMDIEKAQAEFRMKMKEEHNNAETTHSKR